MSKKPSKIVYDLGHGQHDQKLELVIEGDQFMLHKHAANQLDDDVRIYFTPLQAIELRDALEVEE